MVKKNSKGGEISCVGGRDGILSVIVAADYEHLQVLVCRRGWIALPLVTYATRNVNSSLKS